MRELSAEAASSVELTRPGLAELKRIEKLYAEAPDPAALAPKRLATREDLEERLARLNAKHAEFQEFGGQYQWVRSALMVARLGAGEGSDVNDASREIQGAQDVEKGLRVFMISIEEALASDERAFAEASAKYAEKQDRLRQRRTLAWLGGGAAFVLLALAGAWAIRRRHPAAGTAGRGDP